MDINNLYKHSEDALLNDLNQKLKEKVALEVAEQVKEKVPQMQSALIREQKMKQLVSDITDQMVDVNHGFDQIQERLAPACAHARVALALSHTCILALARACHYDYYR